jgi:hypothetical protein
MQRGVGRSVFANRLSGAALVVVVLSLVCVGGAWAEGDANEASCPGETNTSPGFRSYLPDCRAYEQATPVFKDGTELLLAGLSEDGSSMVVQSLGGFAGTESGSDEGNGPTYELSRTDTGWTVSAIMPPAPLFPTSYWLAASPDLARTLWSARTGEESEAAKSLYIREANGSMVKVGPLLPPSAVEGPPSDEYQRDVFFSEATFVAASSDLSHVLFELKDGRELGIAWPGDTTISGGARASLYEYIGTDQSQPKLVGVSDGSTVVPGENEGRPLPEGRLISSCDTYLGSLRASDVYNAVSADGKTVFFTAEQGGCTAPGEVGEGPEVDELYARVDGQQTVAISEPAVGANLACEACNESPRGEAEFAGASRDGSKVFFLTEQELLPGAEGRNLYEYDFDNPPSSSSAPNGKIVRVSGGSATPEVQGVARVSEDGSHVYFVAKGVLTGANGQGTSPASGEDNLYVFERDAAHPAGRLAFVATLAASDSGDWNPTDVRLVQATPNGQFLVFDSVADLTAGDTATARQVFEYDAESEELVRVSRGANDDLARGTVSANEHESGIRVQGYSERDEPQEASTRLYVSEDGAVVLFESAGALTLGVNPAAPAGQESAYEYESAVGGGGRIAEGNVYLIVPESPTISQVVKGLDESGQDMFFQTGASLVPQDSDTQLDLYDARTDGGFPAPDPPAGCIAEACGGVLYAQPVLGTSARASTSGSDDIVAAPVVPVKVEGPDAVAKSKPTKCRKGFARKKGRCVKNKRRTVARSGRSPR